jgi:hypothetical protein
MGPNTEEYTEGATDVADSDEAEDTVDEKELVVGEGRAGGMGTSSSSSRVDKTDFARDSALDAVRGTSMLESLLQRSSSKSLSSQSAYRGIFLCGETISALTVVRFAGSAHFTGTETARLTDCGRWVDALRSRLTDSARWVDALRPGLVRWVDVPCSRLMDSSILGLAMAARTRARALGPSVSSSVSLSASLS